MSIEIARVDEGIGVLVIVGKRMGRTLSVAFHRDNDWMPRVWASRAGSGFIGCVSLLRVALIVDLWTWERR